MSMNRTYAAATATAALALCCLAASWSPGPPKELSEERAAAATPEIKFVKVNMILAGVNESNAAQTDYRLTGGKINTLTFKDGGGQGNDHAFGRKVLSVIPFVRGYHADIMPDGVGRRWWREHEGYFDAAIHQEAPNKVVVAVSPADKGRWPVDLLVIYQ